MGVSAVAKKVGRPRAEPAGDEPKLIAVQVTQEYYDWFAGLAKEPRSTNSAASVRIVSGWSEANGHGAPPPRT